MVRELLSERKEAILLAVIMEYIRTANPVGSQHVLESSSLGLSAASVRSQMANLEKEGYLTQPHISSGRVPSIRGYRYFVDRLMTVDPEERALINRAVSDFLQSCSGDLTEVLDRSLAFLSKQTNYTAVFTTWRAVTEYFKALQVVSLSDDLLLVVAVGSRGTVERVQLSPSRPVDDRLATLIGNFATSVLAGQPMHFPVTPVFSGDPELDWLADEVFEAINRLKIPHDSALKVRELSRTAAALEELDKVARVLETLEQQLQVVSLIRSLIDSGIGISIGEENGLDSLVDCSLVVAPCEIDGELVGSIGILGPTRMDYSRASAAVEALSRRVAQVVR